MMKFIKYLSVGVLFGVTLAKAEIISWYRIFEMFHFDSFHMYGVIGSAVIIGVLLIQWIKRSGMTDLYGEAINLKNKDMSVTRYLVGGVFFGLGWALIGACPGPMFILLGYGYWSILLVIFGAMIGTLCYGLLKNKLPH